MAITTPHQRHNQESGHQPNPAATAAPDDQRSPTDLMAATPVTRQQPAGGLKPIEIATLQPGQPVDGLLACVRKATVNSRTGAPFLAITLRDGHHQIQARAFAHVQNLIGQFDRGDVVHVRGHVTTYRDEPQIRLEHITRHKLTPPTGFIPTSHRSLDELDGYLEHLAREVTHPGYSALLDSLLAHPELRHAWRAAPCTTSGHHAYLGGLLEHTVAVATFALETCSLHPRLNSDLLLSAAIVHDIGLTRSFTYKAEISESPAGRMLGHIELGLELLRAHAGRTRLTREDWQPLAHCVLTHHGPRPTMGREYACLEAVALARIVALDEGLKRALDGGLAA